MGGLIRNFWSENAIAMAVLYEYDCAACLYVYSLCIWYSGEALANNFPPSGW